MVETVNKLDPEGAKSRGRFDDLRPRYPERRLDLEVIGEGATIAMRVVEDCALELVDVELKRRRNGALVQVFVDRQGGIGLEDLQSVSREGYPGFTAG